MMGDLIDRSARVSGRLRDRPDRSQAAGLTALAVGSLVLVLLDVDLPVLRPLAGCYLLVLLPAALVAAKIDWPARTGRREALLYSTALVLLAVMVIGLAMNTVLPHLGVARPLDRIPVAVGASVALLGLTAWRPDSWRWLGARASRRARAPLGTAEQLVSLAAAALPCGAAMGAVRLNNGADGTLATVVLTCGAAVLVAVFVLRHRIRESVVIAAVYLLSLALLLMTSLRGWQLTGHDIQTEYRVFALTARASVWRIDAFQDAYNACLSITILPTVLERMTGISGLYVFKFLMQLLFALCPVLVYSITRRFASISVALIATVYVVVFPTFFTDMPFLIRQELAFFFLGVGLLAATDARWPVRLRRSWLVVFGIGIVLSHYSTTYVFVGVLVGSWILLAVVPAFRRAGAGAGRVVGWPVVVPLILLAALWTGPVTGTGGQIGKTLDALSTALTEGGGDRSSDVTNGLPFLTKVGPQQRLQQYEQQVADQSAPSRARGETYPSSDVDRYPTPVAPETVSVAGLGVTLERLGVPVPTLVTVLRAIASAAVQLFAALGLLLVLFGRARGFRPSAELIAGALAAVGALAAQMLLPALSVDYGLYRTFTQCLFWLAPFIAVGSIQVFAGLSRTAATRFAMATAVTVFLLFTGVVGQVLGSRPTPLHLGNAGRYFDAYYGHVEERAAIDWLAARTADAAPRVPVKVLADRFTVSRLIAYRDADLTGMDVREDSYPAAVGRSAAVFLGYSAVHSDLVTVSVGGDLVGYRYPLDFLDDHKDLVYSSGGARIYR